MCHHTGARDDRLSDVWMEVLESLPVAPVEIPRRHPTSQFSVSGIRHDYGEIVFIINKAHFLAEIGVFIVS